MRVLENIHENNSSAHVKIAGLVYRENIKGAKRLKDICDKIISTEKDPFINHFFQKVSEENESIRFKAV